MVAERVKLRQYPLEDLKVFWRDFEPSDYENHRKCGFIPTGTTCHVCGKTLGKPLAHPYSYQTEVLADDHLTCLIAGGEQVGKSFTGAMKFFRILMGFLGEYSHRAAGEVAWLVGLSYEQTSSEFEYIKAWLKEVQTALPKDVQFSFEASNKIDPGWIRIAVARGTFTIKTKSVDDAAASIRGESPIVTLHCEAAITTHDVYTRLRTRVGRARSDYPGYGAIIMISTFEGSTGWYPILYSQWQLPATMEKENAASYSMPSFSNIFTYKKGEKDPEIQRMKAEVGEDEYKERILAIPSPPKGRVHETFDPTVHVLPQIAKYNPDEDVLIGIDPGYSGQPSSYAVEVVQRRRLPCKRLHYQGIDEIFEWKLTNDKICAIAMTRPWWKAPVKHGVVDVAGTYHAGAQDPVSEVWQKLTGLVLQAEKIDVLPGIRRMDSMLNLCVDSKCGQPVFVLSPNMPGAMAELGGLPHPHDKRVHPYKWATDRTGTVIGHTPNDQYNDATKALTYLFINKLGYTNTERSRKKIRVKKREVAYA